ncbi:hypothetical protein SEA_NERGAL_44 [Mycobacterium Phage Nergal]|nr:hypothetical protein SEA_NERGAL_44 [Mycobacterium Phage Nergal]
MSLFTLPGLPTFRRDDPTFAQRVDSLVGHTFDEALNDPERNVPVVLFVLGVETALTIEHLVELFVLRPIAGAVLR